MWSKTTGVKRHLSKEQGEGDLGREAVDLLATEVKSHICCTDFIFF
jgi:hypothetical protein